QPSGIIAIHNQESAAENEYYRAKTGAIKDLLNNLGIDDDFFTPSGKSSLLTYTDWLAPTHSCIFVHNTFTTTAELYYAKSRFPQAFWCLCPNANLYIENQLP